MATDDLHSLAGAYAVDALDDLERARFEQHLVACPDCTAEVRSFTDTASRLGSSQAMSPPPGLRSAVLAEIARTRQLPPQSAPVRPVQPSRANRWLAVAAVGALLAAGGLGAVAVSAQRDAAQQAELTATVSQVMGDPDRQTVEADVVGGGHATVVAAGGEAVLMADDMAAPPSDAVYVLWMLDADGRNPRAAGVLEPAGDGSYVAVTSGHHDGEQFAVTVETDPDTTTPQGETVMATTTA